LQVKRVAAGGFRGIPGNQFAGEGRDLVILYATEFLILQPEIAFNDFGSGEEAQNCRVPLRNVPCVAGLRFQIGTEQSSGR